MALIKCHECGTEISSSAKTCPKCGAKPKKQKSAASSIVVAILAIGALGAVASVVIPGQGGDTSAATLESKEKKAKSDAEDTKRFSAAVSASEAMRKAARDPESLKFESMRVSDDAKIVCAEYRARNGFGGMNKEIVVFVNDVGTSKISAWNKNCTGRMRDYMYAVN